MNLPLPLDFEPMEARSAKALPPGGEWLYEPKWDGFRCLVFRDGDEVALQSKAGQPLARYFPEMVDFVRALPDTRFVADGEIMVAIDGRLDSDALLQRIHPAESRIRKLAKDTPSMLVLFDLLAEGKTNLTTKPLRDRWRALEQFAARNLKRPRGAQRRGDSGNVRLTESTEDPQEARRWFAQTAGALDGVIAKRYDAAYQAGRTGDMLKIKNLRTADCVVGGFRYGSNERVVGSLLLGLYDEQGKLNHVGFTSSIRAAERPALTRKLERLIEPPGFTGAAPGGPSRWSTERSTEWQPLRPELVAEVEYDHFTKRFRHGTRFIRWRPDKAPRQCTLDQVLQDAAAPLDLLRSA